VTEIQSSLKTLAQLVVRGFHSVEDALIIDMLVRHHCMREDDINTLLKLDKRFIRSRMEALKKDKIVQVKQRIKTDEGSHAVKINCYFINYRTFVNVVKYKLDHMRNKMEKSGRDKTSRASFKCLNCDKTFTDFEVTREMRCTFCTGRVVEDESSEPRKSARLQLARFNLQMKPLYELLHNVETIRIPTYLLNPEPVDIDALPM